MTKQQKMGFGKYLVKHYELFIRSLKMISWLNLLSVLGDVSIVLSLLLFKILSEFIFTKAFINTDLTLVGQSTFSGILINGFFIFLALGGIFMTYILGVSFFTLVNSYVWMRYMKVNTSLKKIGTILKHNSILIGLTLVLLYLMRIMLKDPLWAYVDFFIIIIVVLILPFMHIRFLLGKQKKTFLLIGSSFKFFFSKFKHLIIPGFVMLMVFNVLVMSTSLFSFIPDMINNLLIIILALLALSWIRQYLIVLVKVFDK